MDLFGAHQLLSVIWASHPTQAVGASPQKLPKNYGKTGASKHATYYTPSLQFSQIHVMCDAKKDTCQAALANLAEEFSNSKADKIDYPLNDKHMAAIRKIKNDKDIIISRPDKGNGVVVMQRSDYNDKMNAILADASKFQLLGLTETHDVHPKFTEVEANF